MLRQLLFGLPFAVCSGVAIVAGAYAQQYVATPAHSGQLPYGNIPIYQVAPDGAVHLEGPYGPYAVQSNSPVNTAFQPTPTPYNRQLSPELQTIGSNWNPYTDWLNAPKPEEYVHRLGFFGEFLYLRPRNAGVAYALPIDGPVAPILGNEVPIGSTAIVDPDYEPSFRVGFNIKLNEGASLASQYTNFRSNTSSSATIDAAAGVLRSLVSHPLGANAATDTLDASATLNINYDLVDVDYRGLIVGCENCQGNCAYAVNYLIGGRYAHLDQDFRSNFVVPGTTSVDTNVGFDGGGIRAGLEGEHHSMCTGLYVYGRGVANFMMGQFNADFRQTNSFNGVEAFTDWSAGRIVPVLNMEVGLGWVGPRGHLRFYSGYLVSAWFNVVKTEDFIYATQNHNIRDLSGTLTFDGLVVRGEWRF